MADSFEMQVEDGAALAPFRHKLDRWLAIGGLADVPRADVVLASHEAVANAIEHSNSSQPVLVRADAHADGFVVEMSTRDDGDQLGSCRSRGAVEASV